MDLAGSLRSPDILIPAIIPVTAGKNTAKTTQNPSEWRSAAPHISMLVSSMGLPNIKDNNDSAIPIMIKYWALMATWAETIARMAIPAVVIKPTILKSRDGKTLVILSAKPTVYSATESAWARKRGIPIAPLLLCQVNG